MYTNPYIEALLVEEELADQVWEFWNAGFVSDEVADPAWMMNAAQFCSHAEV